jgi:hypothetical protein
VCCWEERNVLAGSGVVEELVGSESVGIDV